MLIWAHGLWGSPNGSKITAIRESGIEVVSPDFNNMELDESIRILNELVSIQKVFPQDLCISPPYTIIPQSQILLNFLVDLYLYS